MYSHFNPFDVNTPRVGGLVQERFHVLRDALTFAEYFVERPLAHYVPQSCLRQEPGWVMGVLHIRYWHGGIRYAIVHHRIHRHCYAVLRQHLRKEMQKKEWEGF